VLKFGIQVAVAAEFTVTRAMLNLETAAKVAAVTAIDPITVLVQVPVIYMMAQ
jgi:hypothetical protein